MDDFSFEYDETSNPDPVTGRISVARTKKVNSFGIKTLMYPEIRVLKHLLYTTANNVLYKFQSYHWSGNQGVIV